MAKPFTVYKSRFQLPTAVADPVAVTWNNTTIVLAMNDKRLRHVVFIKTSGSGCDKWIQRKTRGIVPGDWSFSDYTAQVINNKMYLFVRQYMGFRGIYCLDLHDWTWTQLTTSGPDCSSGGGLIPSWVYKEKMYHYVDQEVFCYDVSRNIWECQRSRGELPSHLYRCLAVIDEATVFMYTVDGLSILDMETMLWTKIHADARKFLHTTHPIVTLTKVSKSTAILIGQSGNLMACWLLDLWKAKQPMEPPSIWSKIMLHSPLISNYATVLEPKGQELLLIGGQHLGDISSRVLKIPTRFPSLMSLATDCAARSTCTFDQSLQLDQLPIRLRNRIMLCKQEIIGVESVCTKEEGCMQCHTHRYGCLLPPKKRRWKL